MYQISSVDWGKSTLHKGECEMIIDMHTHIWPDKIAERTVKQLASVADIPAYTNGTLENLKESMQRAGITTSVVLPVVTKPEQFETVNRFAVMLNQEPGILSFGGIHPDNDKVREKLKEIRDAGLKGIKLHPDYQKTFIDDLKYQRIIKEALDLGLCISVHAGIDVGLPDPVHCSPERVCNLYEKLNLGDNVDNKLIFAHTGGCGLWEEVYECLAGKKIYFDLSYSFHQIDPKLLVAMIRKHGSKRIVFGTDSPWADQKEMVTYLMKLPLTEEQIEDICYQTAEELLYQ